MDVLWAEMSVLKHLRDDVVRRGERNMDKWVGNVEAQEREVANLRKELKEIRKGSHPNISGYRLDLHKKVIEILGAVADLKREGNRNVVAHRVGAASFLEGNNLMHTRHGNSTETVEKFLGQMAREKPLRFSSTQLKSFTTNFSKHLGSGGYGEVYKGRFPNGVQLAVKVLKDNVKDIVKRQFMAEVSTMGKTYHRNLVRLYGYCFDANLKALVYEFMENGSLDKIIYEDHFKVEWEKLYDIATETAKGLSYLHENCHKRIIHCDVKAGNVLIDANLCAKVADFGLAKLYNRDSSHVTLTRFRGTPGYAAPEMWMPLPVSYKCDVYSFGMMAFEILGRKKNWNRQMGEGQKWFPRQVWEKFERGRLEEVISDCGIDEKDRDKAKILCIVALWCSQYVPQDRPSMSNVVKILEGEIQAMDPPNPFPYMAASGIASISTSVVSTRTPIPVPVELSFSPVSPELSPAFAGWQFEVQSPTQKLTTEVKISNSDTKMVEPEDKKNEVITVVLMVYMHCQACAKEVKKYLMRMKGVQTATADLDRSQITVKGIINAVELVEYIYKKTNKRAMIVKIETEKMEEEKAIAEAARRKQVGKVTEKIELKKKQEEKVIGKAESEKNKGEQGVVKIKLETIIEDKEGVGFVRPKLAEKKDELIGYAPRTKLRREQDKGADKIHWEVKREDNGPARTNPPLKEEEKDTAKSKPAKEEDKDIGKKEAMRKDREKIIEVVTYGKIRPEMKEKRQEALNSKGDQKYQEPEAYPEYMYSYDRTKTGAEQRNCYQYSDHSSYAFQQDIFSDSNTNAWCSIQ